MTELEQLRDHLLTLASSAEWLERAASLAAAAELHERAAEAMVARQRYDAARAHRGTAERLRARQMACEGIAGVVRAPTEPVPKGEPSA